MHPVQTTAASQPRKTEEDEDGRGGATYDAGSFDFGDHGDVAAGETPGWGTVDPLDARYAWEPVAADAADMKVRTTSRASYPPPCI